MDVTFYEKCCVGIDDMSCRNYRERRPVDSGYKDSYEAPDPGKPYTAHADTVSKSLFFTHQYWHLTTS